MFALLKHTSVCITHSTMQQQMCVRFSAGTCNLDANCRRCHNEHELYLVSEAIRKKELPSCDVIRGFQPAAAAAQHKAAPTRQPF